MTQKSARIPTLGLAVLLTVCAVLFSFLPYFVEAEEEPAPCTIEQSYPEIRGCDCPQPRTISQLV